MRFANRIAKLPPYLFAEVDRRIAAKRKEGVDVISLGIGDPDLPTPQPRGRCTVCRRGQALHPPVPGV